MLNTIKARLTSLSPLKIAFLVAFAICLFLVTMPLYLATQLIAVASLVLLLMLLITYEIKNAKERPWLRIFIIFIAGFITLRYFYWRISNTLPDFSYEPLSFVFAFLLLL